MRQPHPLRRAVEHFYPRPPRGGRLHCFRSCDRRYNISIHALREEGDYILCTFTIIHDYFYPRPPRGGRQLFGSIVNHFWQFLSTPSARRATAAMGKACAEVSISIHALREEGDRGHPDASGADREFLSTPSARRATRGHPHAQGADSNFYPRPPRGGRRAAPARRPHTPPISIHALREEGDSKNGEKHLRFCFIIKRSAQIWKSFSKKIQKNSCDLHRTA